MRYIYSIILIFVSNFALATQALVIVDGKAITDLDVNKRIEALKLANPTITVNDGTRKHILNNLISEELFHNEAKRLKVSVTQDEINEEFKSIAKGYNLSPSMLDKLLKNASLYKQVESQILWNKLVSMVLYSKIKVSDAEVRDEQKVRKGEIKEVSFKQIIFDSFDSVKMEKLQIEAQGCENLNKLAIENGLNNIQQNTLLLSELNENLQSIIKALPDNKLSEVLDFNGQKQVIMVCNKNIINNPQDTKLIKQELGNRKINAEAQKYLAELKKRVYIEYVNDKK
jgi:peptidyl-prolyl cis-trans isomerase SurA